MNTTEYEYGISRNLLYELAEYGEPHRAGMTEKAAQQWLAEWVEDGGKEGIFSIVRRPVGRWESVSAVDKERLG